MEDRNLETDRDTDIRGLEERLEAASRLIRKTTQYGVVWMDIPEALEEDSPYKIPVLKEVRENCLGRDSGSPPHIIIEGDNYHSLTCLNFTHAGKIDLIYIDPPYNTGSDGFRYKDKRIFDRFPGGVEVPKDHPLRHSYWLSFMHKRLKLAHRLLKPEGVMFISINEEEYAQLKLLCDSIFRESNYMASFTVKVRHEDRILKGDKDYQETTEQLLLYRKSPKFKAIKRRQDNTSIDKYVYRIEELTDTPQQVLMGSKLVSVFRPGEYRIVKGEPSPEKLQKVNIRGSIKEGNSSGRFHMKYLEERNGLFGYLYKVPDMGGDGYDHRYFLTRESEKHSNGSYFQGIPVNRNDTKEVPYPNLLDFEETFNNVGNEGGVEFRNGKKPVDFLKFVFSLGTSNKNAVILDFFAGSGSTGHAVMELNYRDGGERQFILCTNNENGIAREVTYPRIRNVMEGYPLVKNHKEVLFETPLTTKLLFDNSPILAERDSFFSEDFLSRYDEIREEVRKDRYTIYGIIKKTRFVPGLGGYLKYYKTDFTGNNDVFSLTDEDKLSLARDAGYMIALAEDTPELIGETDYYRIFESDQKRAAVYFREELDRMDVFLSELRSSDKPTVVYLFGWGVSHDFEGIFDDMRNITVKVIPNSIIDAYRNILNPTP